MRLVFLLVFSALSVVQISCNRLGGRSFVPAIPGYDEKEKRMVILKRPLREISGVDYVSRDQLLAINDEAGKIFIVNPFTGLHESFEFGGKGDYEDIVRAGDFYYVLKSNGHLYQVSVSEKKLVQQYRYDFGKDMEFEALFFDTQLNQLVLICKECGRESTAINSYRFDLATQQFIPGVYFTIEWAEIRRMAKNNQLECRPSAAAFNAATNKLYIIASVGKLILQCSRQGVLEQVYQVNPDHFQQPEGITFAPNGDMYISNEGRHGKGTILYFPYTAP